MKKFTKFIVGAALMFGTIAPLASCSGFFGEDGFVITDMTWVQDKDDNILVTFKTTREENSDITVTIPHGMAGKEGVGIKSVTSTNKLDEEGNTLVTIVVKYTDEKLPDTILTVPLKNGKDGKGIKSLNIDHDEAGNIVVKFVYTDDSLSPEIVIPRGEDGVGIDFIDFDDTTDEDNYIITITFDSDVIEPKVITVPKSKDGNGIGMITVDEELSTEEDYVLVITYTNGSEQTINLKKPLTTIWHSGSGMPDPKLGNSGDFYLDTVDGFVYKKGGTEWFFLFSMKGTGSPVTFQVTFNPGVGTEWVDPQLIPTASYRLPVNYGEYIELDRFPEIKKTGYEFAGWYTSEEFNVNAGQFTDLTPVNKDMNLYPRFTAK